MAKNVKINSVVYAEVPQVSIPLAEGQGTAVFYDTTGATAASGDILTGKSAFIGNGFVAGSMPNNGAVSGSISKAGMARMPSRPGSITAKGQSASAARNRPNWSAGISRLA